MEELDAMLHNGSWFIRNHPLILKKWHPDENLLKEDVSTIPVLVKLHVVPVTAFSEDGLSAIATKLGTPLMLDSYTSDMCMQSWGRSSYARVDNDVELGTNGGTTNLVNNRATSIGSSFINVNNSSTGTTRIINKIRKFEELITSGQAILVDEAGNPLKKVEFPGDYDSEDEVASVDNDMARFMASKKIGTIDHGLQLYASSTTLLTLYSNVDWHGCLATPLNVESLIIDEVATGNKSTTSFTQEEGRSYTLIVERINVLEKHILDGKLVFDDDNGKPLAKVDYPANLGYGDEVEPIDNETASILASKAMGVGYGPKILLEQWRENEVDDDYDPYDDDMYKGQEIPDNIQTVCDNLDIKVRVLHGSSCFQYADIFTKGLEFPTASEAHGTRPHTSANKENMDDVGTTAGPTPVGITPGMPSYANVTGKPSGKKVIFCTLFTPGVGGSNGIDVVVPVESIRSISEQFANIRGWLSAIATRLGAGETKKTTSQAHKGIPVGPKVGFKPSKEYRSVSKKHSTNSSSNKKQDVDSTNNVSDLNPFEVLNSVCEDGTSTTPIMYKIGKFENLILMGRSYSSCEETGDPLKSRSIRVIQIVKMRLLSVDNEYGFLIDTEEVDIGLDERGVTTITSTIMLPLLSREMKDLNV
ncbi:hypothetical protein Tco_1457517 [Tanacetum coccineum]